MYYKSGNFCGGKFFAVNQFWLNSLVCVLFTILDTLVHSYAHVYILCLTSRTTVTSVRIPDEDACHHGRNLCVISRVQKGTRAQWRHGRSRDETKYSIYLRVFIFAPNKFSANIYVAWTFPLLKYYNHRVINNREATNLNIATICGCGCHTNVPSGAKIQPFMPGVRRLAER